MTSRIDQLEALFNRELGWDDQQDFEILPNGEIRQVGTTPAEETAPKKPLTFRENLGGEYAC